MPECIVCPVDFAFQKPDVITCSSNRNSPFSALFAFQLSEMRLTVDGLEKERDFYFGKLRDIEVLCQEHDGQEGESTITKSIMDILYATEVSYKYRVLIGFVRFWSSEYGIWRNSLKKCMNCCCLAVMKSDDTLKNKYLNLALFLLFNLHGLSELK